MRTSLVSFLLASTLLASCGGEEPAPERAPAPEASAGDEVGAAPSDAPAASTEAPASSSESARIDAPPPADGSCHPEILASAHARGGICLQPDVGGAMAETCIATLVAQGWVRDHAPERRVAEGTGERIVCARAP